MRKLFRVIIGLSLIVAIGVAVWHGFLREQVYLYLYPVKYGDIVEECAWKYDVPRELVYAVIHTESSFRADAASHAGAKGLMQIMDSTNTWIAEMRGIEADAHRIYEPAVNIDRGVWLLAYLYRQFGAWDEAVAAYNAGYGRVKNWLADERYSSDGKTLDDIPITETKRYVEKVNKALEIYKELYFE